MNILKQFKHYSVYRRTLLFIVFFTALIVATVCLILFFFFTSSTTKEISNISKSMLMQTSYTSKILREQVEMTSSQLLNDNDIFNVLNNRKTDPLLNYRAKTKLQQIQSIYPFISSIGIYNEHTDRYLNTISNSLQLDEGLKLKMRKKDRNQYAEFFPRHMTTSDGTRAMLTFVLFPNYSFLQPSYGSIVVNIDEAYVKNTMQSLKSNQDDNTFIMDEEGLILSHTESNLFMSQPSEAYIDKILRSQLDSDHFISHIEGAKHLVIYVKSSDLNWVFINTKPYNQIISNISDLRNFTLGFASIMILIGIILAAMMANNFYNPLRSLIKKTNAMNKSPSDSNEVENEFTLLTDAFSSLTHRALSSEKHMETSLPVLKKNYCRHLLKGTLYDLSQHDSGKYSFDSELPGPYYKILVFQIDQFESFKNNNSMKQQALFRFALCNIAQELIELHGKGEAVIMEENEISLIWQLEDSNITRSKVMMITNELQKLILQYFKFSISIGIGQIVNDKDKLHTAYQSAKECSNYRLFYGLGSAIDMEMIQDRLSVSSKYPLHIEKKIVTEIQKNHKEMLSAAIHDFIDILQPFSYYHALTYANQLLISILKSFDDTMDIFSEDSKKYYNQIHKLTYYETLEDMEAAIKTFCLEFSDLLNDKNRDKNKHIIEELQQFIQNNYQNPDLSLEMIADLVKLSPGYLGKVFKQYCNNSFNDYLKNIRLEEAKNLLVETNETTAEILNKIGMSSPSYFSAQFKKKYGTSPSRFRSLYTMNKS